MDSMTLAPPRSHGGARPGAGRRPMGDAPRDDSTLKADRRVVAKLKYVAEVRGLSLAELASSILAPEADRLFVEVGGAPAPAPAPAPAKGKGARR